MALLDCSHCGRRVSDISDKCAHCGAPLPPTRAADATPVNRVWTTLQAYVAILMTIVGALWYYRSTAGLSHPPANNGAIYLVSVGIVWYIGLRVWMLVGRMSRSRRNK